MVGNESKLKVAVVVGVFIEGKLPITPMEGWQEILVERCQKLLNSDQSRKCLSEERN